MQCWAQRSFNAWASHRAANCGWKAASNISAGKSAVGGLGGGSQGHVAKRSKSLQAPAAGSRTPVLPPAAAPPPPPPPPHSAGGSQISQRQEKDPFQAAGRAQCDDHEDRRPNRIQHWNDFHKLLTQQLEEVDAHLLPTQQQQEQKSWLLDNLKPLLERHTGGVLQMFGSCANGFWMNGSDVDACLVVRRCASRQSWFTKLRLVQCLVERECMGTAQIVRGARVPVAKLYGKKGAELCDISVNNVAALENSRFVGIMAELDPRVQRLGRFIKHWASRRRINNRSEGTLSTYTLILQLCYFLQTREPPVLPRVKDLLVDPLAGQNESRSVNTAAPSPEMDELSGELRQLPFLTDVAAIQKERRFFQDDRNTESHGELLHGFFKFWGQELFRGGGEEGGQTVMVYDGSRELNDLGVLVMRCPLTGKNVNPFTTTVWWAIHAEFKRAATLLSRQQSLAELCEAAGESPAGCGPRGGQ